MTDSRKKGPPLSSEQEVTLRRVAFGESPERTLRAADVGQLRTLGLITDGKDGLMLTATGRNVLATLPRAMGADGTPLDADLLDALGKALRDYQR
jgi:hypothetical protein